MRSVRLARLAFRSQFGVKPLKESDQPFRPRVLVKNITSSSWGVGFCACCAWAALVVSERAPTPINIERQMKTPAGFSSRRSNARSSGSRSAAFPVHHQDDRSNAAPRGQMPTYALALASAFLFCRFVTRSSTTVGSASVEVSPRLPYSSSAILRRMRRMILPERVFGRLGAN
jgi:hypothetical protein